MSAINLDFIQVNQPSFFIHFAYANVTEQMINRTLEELNLGSIREISFKPTINKKNENGNSVVIHFERWYRNPQADKVRQKLISGEAIKINYSQKSYLQVIAFQSKVKPAEEKIKTFKKPTITFDDDEEEIDFGPKLGPNCAEKFNTPKVKRDEKPRQREQREPRLPRLPREPREPREPIERKRPSTPELPPPIATKQEPKLVVYDDCYVQPDAFDMNSENACKGIMLPPMKKKTVIKKKINFQDSPSDSEDEKDNVSDALYGDI